MATRGISTVIGQLRRAGESDEELLRRFAASRDEAAFAALVGRHGPMVWGVCRRALRGHQDAEDAFQATFLVLARKAAAIASGGPLANWLYGVAHNTARKARAVAARRALRERQVVEMPEPAVAGKDDWDELRPLLDEELSRLPQKFRVCVVLCDLQGKTRKEAAELLGVPEGTVASRLGRARATLARRLAGRGVMTAGAMSACVPVPLVSCTVQAAASFAAGQTAAVSARALALAEGVLKTMLMSRMKIITAVLLLAGILGGWAVTARPAVEAPKGGPATTDKERLQGKWRPVKVEVNGVEVPFAFLQPREGLSAVFAGDTLTTNFLEGWERRKDQPVDYPAFQLKLDPDSRPKTMDLQERGGKALPGIYRLEGDDLTICLRQSGPQQRPSAFVNYWKEGSYTALIVLTRGQGKGRAAVKQEGKLWAAISVREPVFHEGGMGPGFFQINFVLVNDGDKTIDPECGSSQLLINGKELKDWEFIVGNGPKDGRWNALPPNDYLSFGYALGKHFDKPGVYKVVWKGKQFESAELVFRVLPKKGQ